MIQRVYCVIVVGLDEDHLMSMSPLNIHEEIPDTKHWKNEREVAKALRRMAKRIEKGCSFVLTNS